MTFTYFCVLEMLLNTFTVLFFFTIVMFACAFYIWAIKEYDVMIKYFYDNCKAKKINSIILVLQKGVIHILIAGIHRFLIN
jgi:hypothetical protein